MNRGERGQYTVINADVQYTFCMRLYLLKLQTIFMKICYILKTDFIILRSHIKM